MVSVPGGGTSLRCCRSPPLEGTLQRFSSAPTSKVVSALVPAERDCENVQYNVFFNRFTQLEMKLPISMESSQTTIQQKEMESQQSQERVCYWWLEIGVKSHGREFVSICKLSSELLPTLRTILFYRVFGYLLLIYFIWNYTSKI